MIIVLDAARMYRHEFSGATGGLTFAGGVMERSMKHVGVLSGRECTDALGTGGDATRRGERKVKGPLP